MKVLQNEDGKMWKERFGIPNEVEDKSEFLERDFSEQLRDGSSAGIFS